MIRLKDILKEKNLTMTQLAELSGITPANLSNYVNGKISPTLDTMYKIANALDVDITELFAQHDDVCLVAKYKDRMVEIKNEELIAFINKKLEENEEREK